MVFLTNNSYPKVAAHLEKLDRFGIPTPSGDLITSSMAAATLLQPGDTALVVGGPGILEALELRGVSAFEAGDVPAGLKIDVVVVGFDLKFDFARLAAATSALRGGARLVATNGDVTFPAPEGLWPGAGSFVAAVAAAGGAEPVVAGKPFPPVADLVSVTIPSVEMVVGDRPSTDGRFARLVGARFGLVLTGVTSRGHGPVEPEPDLEAPDLAGLVERALAGG